MDKYATPYEERLYRRIRRAELKAVGRCINGPREGDVGRKGVIHGPLVSGSKCARCVEMHKRSA